MIAATSFKDKNVALFGLGGSGQITAQSLLLGGANLVAWDDNPDQVKKSEELGIPTGDLRDVDWSTIDSFVLAPGVPLTHPKPHWTAEIAQENDTEIIGDIEIFVRERRVRAPDSPFIAITGTNGKSTTTALISHIIGSAELNIQMGGNIGTAVLSLDEPHIDNIYVVECSSYQIDLAPSLNPSAGVLLNLTPDHLDRHGSMEHYASVKERLVAQSDFAVIGQDDEYCQKIQERLVEKGVDVFTISTSTNLENGIFLDDTFLIETKGGISRVVADLDGIETLRGKHNAQNAAAAVAVCQVIGLPEQDIVHGLKSFPGLMHRMQPIAKLSNIQFINDSKATNAEATAPALKSYENIFWILGGLPKEGGISSLSPFFDRVEKAFLIGEAAPIFAAEFGGKVEFEISNTLDVAIRNALASAQKFSRDTDRKQVILFSPACASFDQFRNFEIRGDYFVDQVAQIDGIELLVPHTSKGKIDG